MKFSTCHTAGFTMSTNVITSWTTPAAFTTQMTTSGKLSFDSNLIGPESPVKLKFYTPSIKDGVVKLSIQIAWCQDKNGNILFKPEYDGKTVGLDVNWICIRGRVQFPESHFTKEQLDALKFYVERELKEKERVAALKAKGKDDVEEKKFNKWGFVIPGQVIAFVPDLTELVQDPTKPGAKPSNPYYRIKGASLKGVSFQGLEAPAVDCGSVEGSPAEAASLSSAILGRAASVGGSVQSSANPIEELEEAKPF